MKMSFPFQSGWLGFLTAWCLAAGSLSAGQGTTPVRLTPVGNWPGGLRGLAADVQVVGDYAYVVQRDGGGLVIFQAATGLEVGHLALPNAVGIQVVGNLAWVAANGWSDGVMTGSGLQGVDVSDPTRPFLRCSFWISPDPVSSVQVLDGLAYLTSVGYGLDIVNIRDLDRLSYEGGYYTGGTTAAARVVHWGSNTNGACGTIVSNLAFVADGTAALRVLDVTFPTNVTQVSAYSTYGPALDVQLETNRLYGSNLIYACVAEGNYGLEGVNLTDPASPHQLWPAAAYSTLYAAAVRLTTNHRAYVAAHHDGVAVSDLSNPTNVYQANWTNTILVTPGYALRVQPLANRLYVAAREGGVVVWDVTTLTNLSDLTTLSNVTLVAQFGRTGNARHVALADGRAYVADGNAGLAVVDLSVPSHPQLVGGFFTNGIAPTYDVLPDARWVSVLSNRVYLLDYNFGLHILTNADNPAQLAQAGLYGGTRGIGLDVVGNRAFIVDDLGNLSVVSVSDPANPTYLCGFVLGQTESVRVVNNWAYVVNGAGLQILDVSGCPVRWRAQFSTSGFPTGVEVVGNLAYLADQLAGLKVIDVSNPLNPVLKGCFPPLGFPNAISVASNTAYVACLSEGLDVLSADSLTGLDTNCLRTNSVCECAPTNQVRLGGIQLRDSVESVQVAGALVCVTEARYGLTVLVQSNAYPNPPAFWPPGYAVTLSTNQPCTNTNCVAVLNGNLVVSNRICAGGVCTNLPVLVYYTNAYSVISNLLQANDQCAVTLCTNSLVTTVSCLNDHCTTNVTTNVGCANLLCVRWMTTSYTSISNTCVAAITTNFWCGQIETNYTFSVPLLTDAADRHTYVLERLTEFKTNNWTSRGNWVTVATNVGSGDFPFVTDPAATNRQSFYRVRVLP